MHMSLAKDGRSRLESGLWRSAARWLPERERASPSLNQEIERLQRTDEAIAVATGVPRERGLPALPGGRDGRCGPGASAPLPFAHTGKSCSLIPELSAGRAEVQAFERQR
jgi:hypothetical protein